MEFSDLLVAYNLTEAIIKEFQDRLYNKFYEDDASLNIPDEIKERLGKIFDEIELINQELFEMKIEVKKNDKESL